MVAAALVALGLLGGAPPADDPPLTWARFSEVYRQATLSDEGPLSLDERRLWCDPVTSQPTAAQRAAWTKLAELRALAARMATDGGADRGAGWKAIQAQREAARLLRFDAEIRLSDEDNLSAVRAMRQSIAIANGVSADDGLGGIGTRLATIASLRPTLDRAIDQGAVGQETAGALLDDLARYVDGGREDTGRAILADVARARAGLAEAAPDREALQSFLGTILPAGEVEAAAKLDRTEVEAELERSFTVQGKVAAAMAIADPAGRQAALGAIKQELAEHPLTIGSDLADDSLQFATYPDTLASMLGPTLRSLGKIRRGEDVAGQRNAAHAYRKAARAIAGLGADDQVAIEAVRLGGEAIASPDRERARAAAARVRAALREAFAEAAACERCDFQVLDPTARPHFLTEEMLGARGAVRLMLADAWLAVHQTGAASPKDPVAADDPGRPFTRIEAVLDGLRLARHLTTTPSLGQSLVASGLLEEVAEGAGSLAADGSDAEREALRAALAAIDPSDPLRGAEALRRDARWLARRLLAREGETGVARAEETIAKLGARRVAMLVLVDEIRWAGQWSIEKDESAERFAERMRQRYLGSALASGSDCVRVEDLASAASLIKAWSEAWSEAGQEFEEGLRRIGASPGAGLPSWDRAGERAGEALHRLDLSMGAQADGDRAIGIREGGAGKDDDGGGGPVAPRPPA